MNHAERTDAGYVMVATMLLVILIAVFSVTYLAASMQYGKASTFEGDLASARLAAEEGVQLALAELRLGQDTEGDGLGNISFVGNDDRVIRVVTEDLGGRLYRIRSVATVVTTSQGVECLAELISAAGVNADARAAIAAEGPVVTSGNINVDGRDWDEWGIGVLAPGVMGISTTQEFTQKGSSTVGGNGSAPGAPAPANTVEEYANWADGNDNDGDGVIDEELFDGIDNDGDGVIDEDINSFPSDPDVSLGLTPGSLEAAARARGTYFDNYTALSNYLSANGGDVPGGVILYCDFDTWLPTDLGGNFNDPPSIIVHHNAAGTALMKNVHGAFRGLVMADFVEHINGNFVLVGAFMSFSDESIGNAFGNGGADVLYSSEVLTNLPSATLRDSARILSWRRSTVNP